jgi:DNA replication protein DnaC
MLEREGVRAVAECACRVAERGLRRLAAARIPERHRECTLENFTVQRSAHRSLSEARRQAMGFVRAYPMDTYGNGLLFVGPCGVGKTHLAAGILHALVTERGVSGRFFDCKELLKQIQNSYAANSEYTERQVLRPALEAEVLVLDELGAARRTDWVSDMVEHVLNMRYNDRKTTILTTNLAYAPAGAATGSARDAARQETLGDRIGERMLSRLQEMCVIVEMDGPDFRKSLEGRATFAHAAQRFRTTVPE